MGCVADATNVKPQETPEVPKPVGIRHDASYERPRRKAANRFHWAAEGPSVFSGEPLVRNLIFLRDCVTGPPAQRGSRFHSISCIMPHLFPLIWISKWLRIYATSPSSHTTIMARRPWTTNSCSSPVLLPRAVPPSNG